MEQYYLVWVNGHEPKFLPFMHDFKQGAINTANFVARNSTSLVKGDVITVTYDRRIVHTVIVD